MKRASLVLVLVLVACVKGDPITMQPGHGGMIAVADCGYSVVTVDGAEAPEPSNPAVLGPDPTPRLVHLGLVGDPRTSAVVQWRTADEVTRVSTVLYGAGALDHTATGLDFGFRGTAAPTIFRQHQAHLCNLTAGTTYSYQIVSGGQMSPVYQFHTAPDIVANPDTEVVLGFVGDSRGGYDVWQQLIGQLAARTPDMILFSGDAVTIGITQEEWEDFLGRAESLFATNVVIFANGNHEDNAVNFFSQFAMPPDPGSPQSGPSANFGVDWGYAHITVANDTPPDPSLLTGAYRDDLAADLAASASAKWKLVMHHQPMFSASTRHGSSTTLQAAWEPLFDQYHVDLVLNGHDHDFELTKPLVNAVAQATSANATVFVVAGGAGAELYPNGMQSFTQYSESTYSAAIIHVRRDQLTLDAFHPDGTPITAGAFMKTK